MEFSIIIPAYNRHDLSAACLRSLARHTGPELAEIIFVDNASSDATGEAIPPLGKTLFGERFRYVRHPDNKNFSGACNAGAHIATTSLLFFLNNDTTATPDWSSRLLAAFETNPRLGAVAPLLLYPGDSRVQHLGLAVAPERINHLYRFFPSDHPLVRKKRSLQAVTGAALLIPAGIFSTLGGFYEGYSNGCEDLELCRRLLEYGYTVACEPDSVMYHLESQSPGRKDADAANAALFRERCGSCFQPDLMGLLADDGYEILLTPWLDCLPALSRAKAVELTRETGISPARWYAAIQQEPLWTEGYAKLAAGLEKRGDWAAATQFRLYHATFAPSPTSLTLLGKAATMADKPVLAQQSFDQAARIRAITADKQAVALRARNLMESLPAEDPMRPLYAMRAGLQPGHAAYGNCR